ncbi:metalloregulator ArsR/SmtB family transcription factor [Brevibacterium sp. 5221]|jgi:arsenate reductase|uniref:Metalloregulator ArsR/SmtB family transcription factor n=1 Tax=Brevibacterium rongguiense TaxID=2695267 RepID=A0A6N9H408_9MICO|nr:MULTISPECIES: metalloregulator ArsR/SmtB family transcription factor [Bacteria]MBD2764780.1 metalloregulator ArsR/SmtB family transcription factor [Kocuria sp. cx-455]MCT1456262.1 metalloregulator ArsR/SmtB family transcription factor [Kocuria rhizophila]MCT1917748.1 metalloregulator ArsR/SmtB family transcription factor [Kocuria rhizophila]MCT1957013.1 metalloregulator ArsR/SmtB family transcription factor [Kocuria rhizophila]MCT2072929.1 metalloregulator ArsR/SmtB family transcription fac
MTDIALTPAAPDEDCPPQVPPISTALGQEVAATLAGTLKALADPLRLRMLSAIAADPRGESCVCDLADLAEVSQPTVSHHLKVLRTVGLLNSERRGTWVWYSIAPGKSAAVAALLEGFAPAAVAPSVEPETTADAELESMDEHIRRLAADLADATSQLPRETVTSIVRESYTALARSAKITRYLVPLTERFARQRLADLTRNRATAPPQVLFVCVANAGRSQLAAALTRSLSEGRVIARSAGSTPATGIHPHVRDLVADIDREAADEAFPKPLTDDAIRAADVVVTMGCGDACPIVPGVRYEDWAVGDPALASPEGLAAIRDDIAARVSRLLATFTTE